MHIEPVLDALPPGFDALREEAAGEGHRHLDRLAVDWHSGEMRFLGESEALLAAFDTGALAGIGGLTADPYVPGALRLRRFYVARAARRRGIGRALAQRLFYRARAADRPVTVNAAPGSEPFWHSLGLIPDRRDGHTHRLDTG